MNGHFRLGILLAIALLITTCQSVSIRRSIIDEEDSHEEINFMNDLEPSHYDIDTVDIDYMTRHKQVHYMVQSSKHKHGLNSLQLSLIHSMQLLVNAKEIDTTKHQIHHLHLSWQDVKNWLYKEIGINFDCDGCKVLVKAVQLMLDWHVKPTTIAKDLGDLCTDLKYEDHRVCAGLMNMFQEEVLTVLHELSWTSTQICGFILGSSCGDDPDIFTMWNVTFPDVPKPPVVPPVPPKPGAPVMRVLQLADIHVDFEYKSGSNADCGEPVCCHENDGPAKGEPAGNWGDYRYCDTPTWTVENLFQHLAKEEQFDYIIWLGDLPGHKVWNQTRSAQLKTVRYLTQLFQKYFPNKPIFPAVGNHEGSPVNSYPPPFVTGNDSNSWLYGALAKNWTSNNHWLPNNTYSNILRGAFYTVLLKPGLRIISLNMNFCNNENWWLLLNMTDPAGMLQWFIQVLQYSEDNKEKVHVLGHIPPGISNCIKPWSWNYYKIINRYESTVVAQFFGHTHYDSFEMFYDESSNFTRPVSVGYIGPSVTTFHELNPAYRIYKIDGDYKGTSWGVVDHETYIMNLTEANKPGQNPVWQQEYSAKSEYNMQTMFPSDMDNLLHRLKTNNTLFNIYHKFYYHSSGGLKPCEGKCPDPFLCEVRSGRSYDPNLCHGWTGDYGMYLQHLRAHKVC